jgi:hypothetical protein
MSVSSYDVCILIFTEGELVVGGEKLESSSLSGVFLSLLRPPSKWAPIPSLFRMITDRYNKNGNIGPLCARQLATGMNTRLLQYFHSLPVLSGVGSCTAHTVIRVTSHAIYALTALFSPMFKFPC